MSNKIVTRNVSDPVVVTVSFKQLLAEGKEGRVRKTIVFQYDRFLDQRKHPIQASNHPLAAAEIDHREILEYVAGPIDTSYDFTHLTARLRLPFPIWSWPIRDQRQLRRARLGDGIENLAGCFRSTEDKECYWGSKRLYKDGQMVNLSSDILSIVALKFGVNAKGKGSRELGPNDVTGRCGIEYSKVSIPDPQCRKEFGASDSEYTVASNKR